MQVKKFEAPTIQEALDLVKVELGPEAIILQTKKIRKGFSFNSQIFVEVTAAVSERSLSKKNSVDKRLPEDKKTLMQKMPAQKQASLYDKVMDRYFNQASTTQDHVSFGQSAKKITATRYAEIDSEKAVQQKDQAPAFLLSSPLKGAQDSVELSGVSAPGYRREKMESLSTSQASSSDRYTLLEDEVRALRKILEEMKNTSPAPSSAQFKDYESHVGPAHSLDHAPLQDAFDELVMNGVERRLALHLLKKVSFELGDEWSQSSAKVSDALAKEILETIHVISPFERLKTESGYTSSLSGKPRVFALIGPTGVGKTSTLAKLASDLLVRENLKLGLIHFDPLKSASFDQLGTYGKLLQVPIRTVATQQDLRMAMSDFKNLDLILIDTPGKSHKDTDGLKEIQSSLSGVEGLESLLVLSATTRDSELYMAFSQFSVFAPKGLILSKLDEVVSYGGVYNLTQKVKCPLAYFTTGQKIPDDLERATPERLVSLLMDID